jgi:hypothetical protein
MPELATLLREVVDASVDPVTVDEVLGPFEAVPRNRRRGPLLAVATMVVLLCGVAGVLVAQRQARETPTTVPATTTLPDLEDCERHIDQVGGGCAVTDEQASAMLGIPINEPAGIPEGWTLVYHDVRYWPDEQPTVADYNRAWFAEPPEAGVGVCDGMHCEQPDFLQVTVRQALPGETTQNVRIEGTRQWLANGRSYRINSWGVDDSTLDRIANSLE